MTATAEPTTAPATPGADLPFQIAPPLPHIREFREEDAEAVARMWRESISGWPGGGPGGGADSTAARVLSEQRYLNTLATFIAWAPNPEGGPERAVGYCSLFEYASEANTAYVGTLSAHPQWHGKGVGRDLLKASLERTVALGYSRLDLNTWAGNLKAVPLYKKSGYFWVPDTQVKMENYLPLIFRLPAAQAFFRHADWYGDFQRDLSLREDGEKLGKLGVYTYAWERDGRRLKVVIDRRAKGIAALETDRYAVSATIDEPKLPVGLSRQVTWRVENRGQSPASVSVLAEGEDSVRCAFQASGVVERDQTWTNPVTAEQPPESLPSDRPTNRVRSTVVVDGAAVPIVVGTEVVQPLSIRLESQRRWLTPGVAKRIWLTAENGLDVPLEGTLRLSVPAAVAVSGAPEAFTLDASGKASWPLSVRAAEPGTHVVRAHASIRTLPKAADPSVDGKAEAAGSDSPPIEPGTELRTKVFALDLLAGEPGQIFVQREDNRLKLSTDRLLVHFPLREQGSWTPYFSVYDRETDRTILRHSVSLGPPFVPSVFTRSTWTARVEQEPGAVTVVLATTPEVMPDLTFERIVRFSPSGLFKLGFRVANAGDGARQLQVTSGTSVELEMVRATYVAAPLRSGLVVDDSNRFPDWSEPEVTRPERFAEQWMAEFGHGWVGATIWQGAQTVEAGWESPTLTFDLRTVAPGSQVETPPLYLYAGQGDWRTARALWRQLLAPDAPAEDPTPRSAHRAAFDRIAFDHSPAETRLVLTSERTRSLSGTVSVQAPGVPTDSATVDSLSIWRPQDVPIRADLPGEARAVPATIVLDHERTTERTASALIRLGDAAVPVAIEERGEGEDARVTVENGLFRLVLAPAKLGRAVELSTRTPSGEWVNHLHASGAELGVFVWFNPWFGGIHPIMDTRDRSYPGKLAGETFTWTQVERTGAQGNRWRGVLVAAEAKSLQKGVQFETAYLTTGKSNVLAVASRLENRSSALCRFSFSTAFFLAPGGDRTRSVMHFQRPDEPERTQKRVHGGIWTSSGQWCAVEPPSGPVFTTVAASPEATVVPLDMGLEGVHPMVSRRLVLEPGQSREIVAYLILADGIDQARLYRHLSEVGTLA